jgi:hypothetical protein
VSALSNGKNSVINMGQHDVHNLAAAYQRIPAATLAAIKPLQPLNYAVLENNDDACAPQLLGSDNKRLQRVAGRWVTKRLPKDVTLQVALLLIEAENAKTPVLHKVQLNFANGAHLQFERTVPSKPATLQGGQVYDPASVFTKTTAPRVTERREEQRLDFIVDNKGRSLKPNPHRPSSFDPRVLYRTAPNPGPTSQVGYAFTPMSAIAFQVRPCSAITGCRPGIRDTNPAAVNYRPRLLSRSHSPTMFEPIDDRNRTSPVTYSVGRVRPRTATAAATAAAH